MLKKQTVWLLTLLSLMIVLSVFQMNSPKADDFSSIFKEKDETEDPADLTSTDLPPGSDLEASDSLESEGTDISSISTNDDLFTLIRMQLDESRSSQKEQLESVVASSLASGQEKNHAYEEMKEIDQLKIREFIVEESLKDEYGYPDVLVRTKGNQVIVTVKADELSEVEANQIMRLVNDEFGSVQVEVKFQPSNT